jgi:hypothetical protein
LKMSEKTRDLFAGGLVIVLGLGTAGIGQRYKIGTLTQMGPGYFPSALGVLLAFLGLLIGVAALSGKNVVAAAAGAHDAHGFADKFDWRGWACIVGSVLAFMLLAEYAGLVAATFFCVFIACWGDKTANLKSSLLLAAGITIFGVLLFSKVLHVQIPIIRGM